MQNALFQQSACSINIQAPLDYHVLNGDKMISINHRGIYMVNMHVRHSVGGLHCLVQSLHQMKPP